MIDVADLEYMSPASAPPGSLLIHAARSPTYDALLMISGGGPRNALTLTEGERAFRVINGHGVQGPFLRVANPRFVVDRSSALNGFDSSPEPGTLFLSPRGAGIFGIADHAQVGVMLDGTLTAGIDYGNFAGFRHWRVEVGDPADGPQVLFTCRPRGLDGA